MIATCPACGKRYRLPDDAVPAGGRHVRCAACGHGWVVMPDGSAGAAAPVPLAAVPSSPPVVVPPPAAPPPPTAPAATGPAVGTGPARDGRAQADLPPPPTAAVDAAPPRPPLLRTEPLQAPPPPRPLPPPEAAPARLSFTEMRDAMAPPKPRRSAFGLVVAIVVVVLVLGALAVVEFAPADTFTPPRLGLPAPEVVSRSLPDLPGVDLRRVPVVGAQLDRLANPPPPPPSPLRVTAHGQRSVLANGTRVMTVTGTVSNPTDAVVAVERLDAALLDTRGRPLYAWRIDAPGEIAAHRQVAIDSVAANYPAAATVLRVTPR